MPERRVGSAEAAADGAGIDVESLGYFVIRQALAVDECHDGSLLDRQIEQSGAQCGSASDGRRWIICSCGKRRINVSGHLRATSVAPVVVHRTGMHDAAHPRTKTTDEGVVGVKRTEGLQVGILQNVVHNISVTQQSVGEGPQTRIMRSQQLAKRYAIAIFRSPNQRHFVTGWRTAPNTIHRFHPGQKPVAYRRHTPAYGGGA